MKFGLKWVHMARYELILRLDGALWLTIIFKPLLTPKGLLQSNLSLILDVCDRKSLHDLECNRHLQAHGAVCVPESSKLLPRVK